MTTTRTHSAMNSLPDPERHAEFYADVPVKRLIAWGVDTVLIGILTLLIVPFTAFTALFFLPLLFLAVSMAYRTVTLARWSATPGMFLVSLRFLNSSGRPLTGVEAFFHTLIYTVAIGMVFPQVVSAGLMVLGSRAQGLGDHLLGTVAINRAAEV